MTKVPLVQNNKMSKREKPRRYKDINKEYIYMIRSLINLQYLLKHSNKTYCFCFQDSLFCPNHQHCLRHKQINLSRKPQRLVFLSPSSTKNKILNIGYMYKLYEKFKTAWRDTHNTDKNLVHREMKISNQYL